MPGTEGQVCRIRSTAGGGSGFPARSDVSYQLALLRVMGTRCQTAGCNTDSPPALAEQQLCVLHFTLTLEAGCSEMRRETAMRNTSHEPQRVLLRFIMENRQQLTP